MKIEDFQVCKKWRRYGVRAVYRRSNEDQTGRTAEQEQRFSATNVLCWGRKVSGCSLQSVCPAKTTKHAMVRSFLPQYQKKPKTEWKKPIPAIIFRFSSSEFLRESNHEEVPGTDHDEHVQQLSSVIGRSKLAPEVSKRQPSSCKRPAFIIEDNSDWTFTFPDYCKASFLYINVKRSKGVK